MLLGLGIRSALVFFTILVAIRRYGIYATVTGKRMRHAAVGRAKRVRGHVDMHHGARVTDHFARDIVARCKSERLVIFMMALSLNNRPATA